MTRRSVAAWLLTGLLGTASAQRDDRAAPSTQLVDLNVVALDSKGEPVQDLKIADFQLFDNGKAHPIAWFRHYDARPRQLTGLGPHEFSNRSGTAVAHPTVILFDMLNQVFGDRGFTANQLVRYLEPLERSDDLYLYLLTVDGHLYPVHALPTAVAAEPAAVPWTRQIHPMLDQAINVVTRVRPIDIDVLGRIGLTYGALETLARRMEAVPGRKNLVWLSHGVPISVSGARTYDGEPVDFTPQLRKLSETLDQARVAIYPVQLSSPGMTDSTTRNGEPLGGRGGNPNLGMGDNPSGIGTGSGLGSEDTLQQFAGLTGGRAHGSNDIPAAIKQAMNDARTSYQIGYYTPAQSWDGKYHKLRIVCSRKGVRIQSKQGYFAWAPQATGTEEKDAFEAAAASPFDSGEIALRAQLSAAVEGSKLVHVRVVADAQDVLFGLDQQQHTAQLSVKFAGYMADGSASEVPAGVMRLNLDPEQYDKAMREGLVMGGDLQLTPGLRKVRVMVYDHGSRACGSVTIPIVP